MDESNTSTSGPASRLVTEAARREALGRVATTGAHWVGLVVHATRDRQLPPTATTPDEPLGARLDHGAPLTPLADPDTGGENLGAWGVRPSTVGDLLEARDTEGHRVVGELELQCALEAARLAPQLAADLAAAHPGLAERLAQEHAPGLVAEGAVDPAAMLCAQVAAVVAVELVAEVREQLAAVPIGPAGSDPAPAPSH